MIPDSPILAPEMSTFQTGTVASATIAFARRHLGPKPKSNRHQSNVKRTRQKDITTPEPDPYLSDTEDDSMDEIHGEKLDNCPQDLAHYDGESTNGPRSIKTVSCRWL